MGTQLTHPNVTNSAWWRNQVRATLRKINALTKDPADGSDVGVVEDNLVASASVQDLAISTGKLADSAVTEGKIEDSAVTTNKLNDKAVTTDKINDSAVDGTKIDAGAVSPATHFACGDVTINMMPKQYSDFAGDPVISACSSSIHDDQLMFGRMCLMYVASDLVVLSDSYADNLALKAGDYILSFYYYTGDGDAKDIECGFFRGGVADTVETIAIENDGVVRRAWVRLSLVYDADYSIGFDRCGGSVVISLIQLEKCTATSKEPSPYAHHNLYRGVANPELSDRGILRLATGVPVDLDGGSSNVIYDGGSGLSKNGAATDCTLASGKKIRVGSQDVIDASGNLAIASGKTFTIGSTTVIDSSGNLSPAGDVNIKSGKKLQYNGSTIMSGGLIDVDVITGAQKRRVLYAMFAEALGGGATVKEVTTNSTSYTCFYDGPIYLTDSDDKYVDLNIQLWCSNGIGDATYVKIEVDGSYYEEVYTTVAAPAWQTKQKTLNVGGTGLKVMKLYIKTTNGAFTAKARYGVVEQARKV